MPSTFEWMDFPEGRARFSGGIRGFDELGHETFAIEIDGNEYFGEMKKRWLPDEASYDIEVTSFGYSIQREVGMPITSWSVRIFTGEQLDSTRNLIVKLIAAGTSFTDEPLILSKSSGAIFTGNIIFNECWSLIDKNDAQVVK
ncbi:hypothetical protein [Xanthomonas nasturtii]|uniref:hypothetical protein n=1 Tax=Xanthomonas nasturtii TaxID=1843581 RepID=UPI0020116104|nr:hypothetical protein [Xanthomonas nasturtii]MCL1500610.1 hypothetical protein [Xanthomonas nasturtii]MCL1505277.1 hypothetical protein [Xanthomonas nasturtii]MCL1524195.1 hypothetical protein [Xanthomonas nasturtii]